eukprot:TRINITY_DN9163_c0_g2_i1.p1 TRINITY_DN9163_c0_g2~~TRINITY_DN9163_c0_g2_i1.p1  ORF type:complete len:242 (+),score=85.07 TRINITY_DN9163_c0_g2_i1:49-726(+)
MAALSRMGVVAGRAALAAVPRAARRAAPHTALPLVGQRRWASDWGKWKEQMQNQAQESVAASAWVEQNGSPFVVLGLKEGASNEEVRNSYRKLSMKMHPDKGGSLEDFQKIQYAQNIILKGIYSSGDDKQGGPRVPISPRARLILFALAGISASAVFYLFVFLPLRWAGRKVGLVSTPVVSGPEASLKEEVKRLQCEVTKLQETLEEVREEVKKSRAGRRPVPRS